MHLLEINLFYPQHVEKVLKHKQLELQLAEAKMAQQHLQFDEDKTRTLTENQMVINHLTYFLTCMIVFAKYFWLKSNKCG